MKAQTKKILFKSGDVDGHSGLNHRDSIKLLVKSKMDSRHKKTNLCNIKDL